MTPDQLKNILEAALMTSSGTMSLNQFVSLFEKDENKPERLEIRAALDQLQQELSYKSGSVQQFRVIARHRNLDLDTSPSPSADVICKIKLSETNKAPTEVF